VSKDVYASAFALRLDGSAQPRTAEQWARGVFEGAPPLLRSVILFGWRFFLGLRLQPLDAPEQVLGWRIEGDATGPDTVTLAADSPLLHAENIVAVDGTVVLWVTLVRFEGRAGRLLWTVASAMHHVVIPFLLGRAARSSTVDSVTPEATAPGKSANGHDAAQP
jgi:hypothetical protein